MKTVLGTATVTLLCLILAGYAGRNDARMVAQRAQSTPPAAAALIKPQTAPRAASPTFIVVGNDKGGPAHGTAASKDGRFTEARLLADLPKGEPRILAEAPLGVPSLIPGPAPR